MNARIVVAYAMMVSIWGTTWFAIKIALTGFPPTYYAETHLASGLIAVLFGAMPFFIFGLGALMLRETITLQTIAGAVLALGGVATISLTGEGGALIYVLAAALSAFGVV